MKKEQTVVYSNVSKIPLGKTLLCVLVGILILAGLFYQIAGEELHYRESRGNLEIITPEAPSIELTDTTKVVQEFSVPIQMLEEISVQWGTYYRANTGTVFITLRNRQTGQVLWEDTLSAGEITEGQVTTFSMPSPIETIYNQPLTLEFTADSPAGLGVSPLWYSQVEDSHQKLFYNDEQGEAVAGALSFSVHGRDRIWTGLHYWELVLGVGLLLMALVIQICWCQKNQRAHMVLRSIHTWKRYRFLLTQLVNRDFKGKYKRSIIGVFWSFLNPLLMMIVQYIVFSNLFRFDIPHYPVYLIAGMILFNFFAEACGMMITSIIGNSALIMKVYIPKYIFPLTRTVSSMINLLISLIPLALVIVFNGVKPSVSFLLLPYPLFCLMLFTLGMGLILSTAMVFFRDTQFLWGILNTVWMYLTPLFYPESILPPAVLQIVKLNPLYHYVGFVRELILNGVSPEPMVYVRCFLMGLVALMIGCIVFKKNQNNFVLYL